MRRFISGLLVSLSIAASACRQEHPDGTVTFHPRPPPTDAEVEAITARVVRRTARLLARRDADRAGDDEPVSTPTPRPRPSMPPP